MAFHRIFVIDFCALGLGEAPDANRFDALGADTLGHVAAQLDGHLNLPTLTRLGLGNIRIDNPVPGVPATTSPEGFFGKLNVAASTNNLATGLREMWDYTGAYRTESVLDTLQFSGYPVTLASSFMSYLESQALTERFQLGDNKTAFRILYERLDMSYSGLVYVQLPEFTFLGEERDAQTFGHKLQTADHYVAQMMQDMGANDLLILTSNHASDPTYPRDPVLTREYLPLLVYSPSRPNGHSLGIRRTLADVGTSIMENYGLEVANGGHSFLNEITQ